MIGPDLRRKYRDYRDENKEIKVRKTQFHYINKNTVYKISPYINKVDKLYNKLKNINSDIEKNIENYGKIYSKEKYIL